jgi:hypothetical protein
MSVMNMCEGSLSCNICEVGCSGGQCIERKHYWEIILDFFLVIFSEVLPLQ